MKRWSPHSKARIERKNASDEHDRAAKYMPRDRYRMRTMMLRCRNFIALNFGFNGIFGTFIGHTKLDFGRCERQIWTDNICHSSDAIRGHYEGDHDK